MPGSSLGITLPVVGTSTWPTWAAGIHSALTTIINDLEPLVTANELGIDDELILNGNPVTDAQWVNFRAGNTVALPTYGLGFKNGDVWATDGAGREVQITGNGSVLGGSNGFRGDVAYAYYTASSDLYEFKDSAGDYDYVKAARFQVANGASNAVTLIYGGASSFNLTFPSTPGLGTSLLTVDASGQIAHNATVTTGVTFNNANITLSGTSDIKHPDRSATLRAGACMYRETSGSATIDGAGVVTGTAASWIVYLAGDSQVNLVGNRLKSATVRISKGLSDTTTVSLYLVTPTGSLTLINSATTTTTGASNVTVTVGSPTALASGESYVATIQFGSATTNTVGRVDFTWDRA